MGGRAPRRDTRSHLAEEPSFAALIRETALDEQAFLMGIDPLQLRLRSRAVEPPQTTASANPDLRQCYTLGAQRFGWNHRSPAPRSMRNGRWLVGWGLGAANPSGNAPAFGAVFVELSIDRDLGRIRVPRIAATYYTARGLDGEGALDHLRRGLVQGVTHALSQTVGRDASTGRFVDADLRASDLPPTANLQLLDVGFQGEPGPQVDASDARALRDIGAEGIVGALGNAVFHATGKRVRDLPFALDDILL